MKNNKKNSKPKFLLSLIGIAFLGILLGILLSSVNTQDFIYNFFVNLQTILDRNIFLIFISFIVLVDIFVLLLYFIGKNKILKAIKKDEEIIDDKYLSIAIGLIGIGSIFPIIFLINYYRVGLDQGFNIIESLIALAFFVGNIIILQYIYGLIVKFIASYEPNKYDNVLDMKFTKKFMETMDERELFDTYKASFRAYKSMKTTIFVLIIILTIVSVRFPISLLPIYSLGLVFFVGYISYIVEAIKK